MSADDGSRIGVSVLMGPAVRPLALPPAVMERLLCTAREVDLAEAEVLLTGWGSPTLDGELLAAAPKVRAVMHAAGSVKPIVTEELWRRGVTVSSAAGANAAFVATYTLAMMHLAAKRVLPVAAAYAAGNHIDGTTDARLGLPGKTVGVVGASKIGRLVLPGLAGAGCEVLLSDPLVSAEEAGALGATLVGLDELFHRSHIVSLHAPLLPETENLVDGARLAMMSDGGVLINTARGRLVDTEALARECATGRLDAILDVTEPEPLPAGHALFGLPNVLVTSHVAGAMGSEVSALGGFAVAEIERFVRGEPLYGEVFPEQLVTLA